MEHNTCVVCGGAIYSNYVNKSSSVQVSGDKYTGFNIVIRDVSASGYDTGQQYEYHCNDCGLIYKHLPKIKGNYNE